MLSKKKTSVPHHQPHALGSSFPNILVEGPIDNSRKRKNEGEADRKLQEAQATITRLRNERNELRDENAQIAESYLNTALEGAESKQTLNENLEVLRYELAAAQQRNAELASQLAAAQHTAAYYQRQSFMPPFHGMMQPAGMPPVLLPLPFAQPFAQQAAQQAEHPGAHYPSFMMQPATPVTRAASVFYPENQGPL